MAKIELHSFDHCYSSGRTNARYQKSRTTFIKRLYYIVLYTSNVLWLTYQHPSQAPKPMDR